MGAPCARAQIMGRSSACRRRVISDCIVRAYAGNLRAPLHLKMWGSPPIVQMGNEYDVECGRAEHVEVKPEPTSGEEDRNG